MNDLANPIKTKTKIRVSKIIRIDINTSQAYALRKLMQEYATKNRQRFDSQTADMIAHKLWVGLYKANFKSDPVPLNFTCLTTAWVRFCKEVVESHVERFPSNVELRQLLMNITNGKEIKSC
jgi:hypothetical protein